jgi:hypothetical protein
MNETGNDDISKLLIFKINYNFTASDMIINDVRHKLVSFVGQRIKTEINLKIIFKFKIIINQRHNFDVTKFLCITFFET